MVKAFTSATPFPYTPCVVHQKYDRDWHPEDEYSPR